MKVRGLTILTRKVIITRAFGTDAWLQLYRDIATAHPCFRPLIAPDTLIPLSDYLAFHDALVGRFYGETAASHAALGRESARWALVDGPCKRFLDHKDLAGFAQGFPAFWKTYFSDTRSRSEAWVNGDSVEFKTFDLPQWHPYFEHFVMGYMTEALEMFCAGPMAATRLGGGENGYHYLIHSAFDPPARVPQLVTAAGERPPARKTTRRLSSREMEVLRLLADEKTNEEIGILLGISTKTVQHHVAHTYRKLDVSGRVGAVMWLARRGTTER